MTMIPVPSETIERVRGILASKFPEELAALTNFQTTTRAVIDQGIGYIQSPFIGDILLPPVLMTPDGLEIASYPVWGKERFDITSDDKISVSGEVSRADLGMTWATCTVETRGREVYIDPRETRAADAMGIRIVAAKTELARSKVQLKREYLQAQTVASSSSYLNSSYYETLSGTGQWSHTSSTPIAAIIAKIEFLRGVHGIRPDVMWLSPNALRALRFHSTFSALAQYTATPGRPAAPVSLELISAVLGVSIVTGESIYIGTASGTTFVDMYGDSAGLLYSLPGAGLYAPRFGMTVTGGGFPKVLPYRDEKQGAEGSDVYRYIDSYKTVVTLNTAGYLWLDTTNY